MFKEKLGVNVVKKVLIVDDQVGIRVLLQEVLKKEGYDICVAGSGIEALEKLNTQSFDALLIDMKLPGMTGVEVLEQLGDKRLHMHLMLMTAYGENALIERAKSLGVHHFFTKPFNIHEVRETVNNLLK